MAVMDFRWLLVVLTTLAGGVIALAKFTDALSRLSALSSKIIAHFRKTTIPVRLGWDRAAVRKALGEPDREGPGFDTFFAKGVAIFYGKDGTVDGIWASRMETGTEFTGKIKGISLGDTFDKCKRELGDPQEWGLPSSHFSFAVWTRDQDLLLLEIWRQRPTVGEYVDILPGTVKSIRLAHKNSITVYEAVVAVAIEFIRQGRRPPQLEEHAIVDVDLNAPYFRQDYEIFGTAGHLGGGANVGVAFAGGQALAFWIYPLAGIQPAIRAICPLKSKTHDDEMLSSPLEMRTSKTFYHLSSERDKILLEDESQPSDLTKGMQIKIKGSEYRVVEWKHVVRDPSGQDGLHIYLSPIGKPWTEVF